MSSPIAAPSDLGTYLNVDTIDTARATLILGMAQSLCETIVNPLPPTAKAVVLDVAARAFVNPQQIAEAGIGTAHLQYGSSNGSAIGGLYLSRTNKAALRSLAGRGGAFNIETMPIGANSVQTVFVTATAGTFTLGLNGAATSPLAYNIDTASLQAALEGLGTIGPGNVTVTSGYTVTFTGALGLQPVAPLVGDATSLTGDLFIERTIIGAVTPTPRLPYWDNGYASPWSW